MGVPYCAVSNLPHSFIGDCCWEAPWDLMTWDFAFFFRRRLARRSSLVVRRICPNPHIPYKNNKKHPLCRPISTTSSPPSAHPYSTPFPTPPQLVWAQNTSDDVFEVLPSLPTIPSSQTPSLNSRFSTRTSRRTLLLDGTAESSRQ